MVSEPVRPYGFHWHERVLLYHCWLSRLCASAVILVRGRRGGRRGGFNPGWMRWSAFDDCDWSLPVRTVYWHFTTVWHPLLVFLPLVMGRLCTLYYLTILSLFGIRFLACLIFVPAPGHFCCWRLGVLPLSPYAFAVDLAFLPPLPCAFCKPHAIWRSINRFTFRISCWISTISMTMPNLTKPERHLKLGVFLLIIGGLPF